VAAGGKPLIRWQNLPDNRKIEGSEAAQLIAYNGMANA